MKAAYTDGALHQPSTFRNSSWAVKAILDLHFPEAAILDVNYGLGVFHRRTHRKVVGLDIEPVAHVQGDNNRLPFFDNSFDVGVVDPPYKRGDGLKYEQRYGKAPKTETQVTWSYYGALEELIRVVRWGLIIKLQDGTDGHRFHARLFHVMKWMEEKTRLEPHDICHVVRRALSNTMVRGRPHFFKQAVSYFLIYRWRQKCPFKPIRF